MPAERAARLSGEDFTRVEFAQHPTDQLLVMSTKRVADSSRGHLSLQIETATVIPGYRIARLRTPANTRDLTETARPTGSRSIEGASTRPYDECHIQ